MRTGIFDRERALALYPEQNALDRLVEKDRDRFLKALQQTGAAVSRNPQTEPVNAASQRFLSELSAEQAASETGLEMKEFQSRVRRSARLVASGFGQLLVEGGGIKRDVWEKSFGELARELEIGEFTPARLIISRGNGAQPFRPNLSSADPTEILRAARTIFISSMTVFLKPEQLEAELRKRPEFQSLGLTIIKDSRAADLRVALDRPLFTYTFTYSVTGAERSIQATSGKVTAFDGNFAAPKIAKEILKRLQEARSVQ
jgi:hypothetical protein